MASNLRYQLELFWLALGFFSRIPIPANTPYSEQRMNQAGRYFGLVGCVIGAICAGAYFAFSLLFPVSVAVFLTMVLSLMLTGAFHEDGLTDMADGIGGGMTLEKRLTIMKDSRIGTYGASALVMALLGKFILLTELAQSSNVMVILFVAYTISRCIAASLIFDMAYVSDPDSSKSKPLANRQSQSELTIIVATAICASLLLEIHVAVSILAAALLFRTLFKHWLNKRLGGFTGDCLGGAQQLTELLTYLVVLAWVS
ncbi:adenosylcobinamide-GDP ribazoletransferase [Vibrio sp. LaRot3]|uniref:adenosylcobinamide-GDP ribazoletransferase n=1 Tax=Vibrio sp. LaRot3 TaxID=2998829 RepID=UPI0022CE0D10|nr:adenosylcobinamide-GDP ribazoletransferase [Vibrio sp. LaRot3]MDA0147650.1 adenosylcobinamide-GDP ribazoletransferase [Vibrio sp. LaRot3]